jgi:hypothetical protein
MQAPAGRSHAKLIAVDFIACVVAYFKHSRASTTSFPHAAVFRQSAGC